MFDKLKQEFGDQITGSNLEGIDPWIEVAPEAIVDVCRYLRDDPATNFDYLNSITGVDYCPRQEGKKFPGDERMEVVYHLWSVKHKHSLVLKVILPRWKDDVEGDATEMPSVSGVWRAADWHEREAYDLCGIRFTNHPNLKRILCPEDWVGYPLRKDYVMPLEYHGIRGR